MRKLASVQIISNIEPIENADMIEKATVLGWEVVIAKKDNFKIGDKVIYIEVDSVMPEKPEYEFLRSRKFRIRTIKLKGQVSQGLILPLANSLAVKTSVEVGQDVTESLGIEKYLSPSERDEAANQEQLIKLEKSRLKKFMMRYSWFRRLFLTEKQKGGFPYWVSKTDEERIQNIPQVIEQFKDHVVYVTEKVDYQSVTFTGKMIKKYKFLPFKKYKFVVCSRNMTTNNKKSLYWQIAEKYNIENILKQNPNITIQGEQGSPKIQGNKYGIIAPTFWVFNIINHATGQYFDYLQMFNFCKKHNLQTVPLMGFYKLHEIGHSVPELVQFSKGKSVINTSIHREGVVVRSIVNGKKLLSFKVINPDFLLKYDE
jgi:hypothetical protein